MKKRVVVISLGGSLIVPAKIDLKFLQKFEEILKKHTRKYKFVVVCGGGTVARKYIKALRANKSSEYMQNLVGISVTRLNARFMSYIFDEDPDFGIPHDMKHVKGLLRKNNIVFCGALRYAPHQTSDSTSAKLANYLKADFINMTNVKGLYDRDPKKKGAKFIPRATREELYKLIKAVKAKPGQHAPLDMVAMKVIKKNKIPLYIIGKDLKQLKNILDGKKFIGTIVD